MKAFYAWENYYFKDYEPVSYKLAATPAVWLIS